MYLTEFSMYHAQKVQAENKPNLLVRFIRHMKFHQPELGFYRSVRLAAAFTFGEIRDRFIPRWIDYRQERLDFDKKYNVDTAERLHVSEMSPAEVEKRHAIRYEPSESQTLLDALKMVPINPAEYTFIDIGAGKGKVLFVASSFAFKRIIGVEYDTYLAKVIKRNITSYRNPQRQCDTIEAHNINALEFKLPAGPVILFMYFPFRAPLLAEVFKNFGGRLNDCLLIWVTLENAEEAVINSFSELSLFEKSGEISIYLGSNIIIPSE